MNNPFVKELSRKKNEREVFISFDNSILIRLKDEVLRLDGIVYSNESIKEGQFVENGANEDIIKG